MKNTNKKLLSLILAVIMVLSAIPFTGLMSLAVTSGDFEYWVISEEEKICEISEYTGSATEVYIPSELNGYSIVSIAYGIFSDCTSLTKITVSENNTYYCDVDGVLYNKDISNLITYPAAKPETQYTIPDSVTHIEDNAFSNCSYLTDITIGSSLKNYGSGSGTTSIDAYTFRIALHLPALPFQKTIRIIATMTAFCLIKI